MITGYNTDVRHGNRVFHVQTEDKGLSNPKIETLIYVGGEILDSYRSSYEDLTVAPPVTESVIQSRMDEQHRAVIRDIKNGKYDLTPPDLLEQQAFNDRPLDQAILEFLQQEGDVDTLELVLDQPLKPAFGSLFKVQVRARLCQSQSPVFRRRGGGEARVQPQEGHGPAVGENRRRWFLRGGGSAASQPARPVRRGRELHQ